MPILTEPLAPALRAMLRRAVLDLVRSERRRTFPPTLHVGEPGHRVTSFDLAGTDDLDHAWRADVIGAMLHGVATQPPLVWWTRSGEHILGDVDAAWLAAAEAAGAEGGHSLTVVVVTRHGWWDPRSGARQVWRRLRQR